MDYEFNDPSLCSIDGEGDGGGGGGGGGGEGGAGGAADALAGAGGDDKGGGGGGTGTGGGGGGGDGGAEEAKWLEQFSAEGGDAENPSNRDWLKSKGWKTVDDMVKSHREAEKAIHDKGGIKVPGDGAKPEEIAAFHKAIGVPENAEGYKFDMPEGLTEDMLDMPLLGAIAPIALEAGVPAAGYKKLVEGVIATQLDALAASKTAENGNRDDLFKEWGAQKDAKLADVNNAMRALGLKPTDVAAMQRGFAMQYGEPGSRRTLELLQKLGAGLAEDTLLGGDGPRRFGVSGAEAQKEIDRLILDPEFQRKLTAKEPEATARWDRLNSAVAADRERELRAAGAVLPPTT